jgi:hypothetical protein
VRGLDPALADVLHHASLSPSGHNAQPWMVRVPEPKHMLSFGCFLEHRIVAARHRGLDFDYQVVGTTPAHPDVLELSLRRATPAAVLDLPCFFKTIGERAVRATFSNAGFTVSADLSFNLDGDLVGFVSADRASDREGGAALWSTPISGYRVVDGIRVGTLGDASWIDAGGEWTYGRFEITSIAYNVSH